MNKFRYHMQFTIICVCAECSKSQVLIMHISQPSLQFLVEIGHGALPFSRNPAAGEGGNQEFQDLLKVGTGIG